MGGWGKETLGVGLRLVAFFDAGASRKLPWSGGGLRERYGGLFYRLAGKLKRLKEQAKAAGRAWLPGHGGARQLYAEAV